MNPAGGGGPAGLVGWWKFDEGSGATAAGSGSAGQPGSLIGGPQWIPGRSGQGLSLTGAQYVDAGPSQIFSGFISLTVSAWVKPTGANNVRPVVVWESGSWDHYSLGFKDGGSASLLGVYFSVNVPGGPQTVFLNKTDWNTGTWYRITGSYDNATGALKVYVDSAAPGQVLLTPGTPIFAPGFGAQRLFLGGEPGASGGIGLDDVRIYNRALTEAEVAALAQ